MGPSLRPWPPSGTPGKSVTKEAEKPGSVSGVGGMQKKVPLTAVSNSPSPAGGATGAPLAVGLCMHPVPVNDVQVASKRGAGTGARAEARPAAPCMGEAPAPRTCWGVGAIWLGRTTVLPWACRTAQDQSSDCSARAGEGPHGSPLMCAHEPKAATEALGQRGAPLTSCTAPSAERTKVGHQGWPDCSALRWLSTRSLRSASRGGMT